VRVVLGEQEPVEVWERRPGASLAPLRRYRRREPEKTLLHAVVRSRLEPFLAAARDRSAAGRGLPAYVERDLRAYLDCGILARGFARIRCPDCGFERLVAFSCKARSCPSCNARRMEDGAEHLVNDVLPAVPVRQWAGRGADLRGGAGAGERRGALRAQAEAHGHAPRRPAAGGGGRLNQ
jgi:hypothetical protein